MNGMNGHHHHPPRPFFVFSYFNHHVNRYSSLLFTSRFYKMLASPFCLRSVTAMGSVTDHTNATASHSLSFHFSPSPLCLRFRCPKSILISCNSYRGPSRIRSSFDDHHNNNHFLPASLLLSETISHYHMWSHRFRDDLLWKSSEPSTPLSFQGKNTRTYNDNSLMRQGFLQRFQDPTIFLKISCDGDYILPIAVGKIAIEKLIDAEAEQENGDCPDQFKFVKNLVERLDHEVIMVRITERVVSTYFARLYLSQPGKSDIISVDVRPSDAINIANRCKAPIYVSKHIVLTDAIRLGYGMGRARNKKPIYDVLLDSPGDGPDSVAQELSMMHNMHTAIRQERFKDAASWRDKLAYLRKSSQDH